MTQNEALDILKTGANVFLTGEPGAGKTHTVNAFVAYLHSCGLEPAITASTGIAATHIGGMTIHSWSGIGIKKNLSEYDLEEIAGKERIAKRIRIAKTLIIDEVSMLDGRTLEMVDRVCKTVRDSASSFGGLQVVLVGDFFQLPPIARNGDIAQFAFESNTWRELNPLICYLSEQHRQEDAEFLKILAALRSGTINARHKECLSGRCVSGEAGGKNVPEDISRLYPHNADVDRINLEALAKLPGKERIFEMSGRGNPLLIDQLKRGCLSPERLALKIGARAMFTKNSPQGKFVNGTTGEIIAFSTENGSPVVRARNGRTITVEPMEWGIEADGKLLAKIIQIPLRLAWAITVHKSQGMSLDAAFVDLSLAFEYGQGYVALSRVRTLDGLYLGGLNDRALQVHASVLAKDSELRAAGTEAATAFRTFTPAVLERMQLDFLRASGGKPGAGPKPPRKKREKGESIAKTLCLLHEGKNIAEIARVRNLAPTTIVGHVEHLYANDKIATAEIASLLRGKETEVAKINTAFRELRTDRLSPVYEHFRGRYGYDFIRLARLLKNDAI